MQNPNHREAFTLFTAQPGKLRSGFVVNCIPETQEAEKLEKMVRQEVSEALKGIAFSIAASQNAVNSIQATEDVSDLLDALLSSLEEI